MVISSNSCREERLVNPSAKSVIVWLTLIAPFCFIKMYVLEERSCHWIWVKSVRRLPNPVPHSLGVRLHFHLTWKVRYHTFIILRTIIVKAWVRMYHAYNEQGTIARIFLLKSSSRKLWTWRNPGGMTHSTRFAFLWSIIFYIEAIFREEE